MRNRYFVTLAIAAALMVSGRLAIAATDTVVPVFETDKVMTEQRQIRSDAKARAGRYKYMDDDQRSRLLGAQSRLFAIIDSRSYGELSADQRLQAFNALESISAIVNNEDDERMVCERVKTVGSNRIQRVCKTVAQREYEREQARDDLSQKNKLGR